MIDFRRLERESYGLAPEQRERIELTPELLGQLISCALQLEGSSLENISSAVFERLFLDPGRDVPKSIIDILHIESRVGGSQVEELTRMTVGSQASGLAGRMNPDNVNMIPKTDPLQAYTLLSHYAVTFPEEVKWLREAIRQRALENEEA